MSPRWIAVWARAVIWPAARRAEAAWIGCGLVAAVIFGPTAMHPADLTGLAIHDPGVGLVLGGLWLLIFVPTARPIVRPPGAAYLASLPGSPRAARALAWTALIWLQLPWAVLWLWGESWLGAGVVVATAAVAAGLASVALPRRRRPPPVWRSGAGALIGLQLRALVRRGGDALVRGAGLALLAGLAGGLFIRNNELTGVHAAAVGATVIAVVAMPAQVGPALVTLGAYRESAWLAQANGISSAARTLAVVAAVGCVHAGTALIAAVVAMVIGAPTPWLPVLAIGVAVGTSLGETRAILAAAGSPTAGARIAVGAIVMAAVVVLCLSVLGASGVPAVVAIGALWLARVAP